MKMSDERTLAAELTSWLKEQVEASGGKGAVFGLSGGLDSAVVAALCRRAFAENCLGVIMPCHSSPEDHEDAELVASKLRLPVRRVNLDAPYDKILESLADEEEGKLSTDDSLKLVRANIKPRLRMIVLYYFAALYHYRVIGTSNKSEYRIGYFTKHGDGACDFLPLADLVKKEVYRLARYLEIPERVLNKPPSGGLWSGQTDEEELGLSYAQIDSYLLGEKSSAADRIQLLEVNSVHKRSLPKIFKLS